MLFKTNKKNRILTIFENFQSYLELYMFKIVLSFHNVRFNVNFIDKKKNI